SIAHRLASRSRISSSNTSSRAGGGGGGATTTGGFLSVLRPFSAMNRTSAITRKSNSVCRKVPYLINTSLPVGSLPRLIARSLKLTPPMVLPRTGMNTSPTSEETILPNAAPMITPTAKSTTLPFMANSLNSDAKLISALSSSGRSLGGAVNATMIIQRRQASQAPKGSQLWRQWLAPAALSRRRALRRRLAPSGHTRLELLEPIPARGAKKTKPRTPHQQEADAQQCTGPRHCRVRLGHRARGHGFAEEHHRGLQRAAALLAIDQLEFLALDLFEHGIAI